MLPGLQRQFSGQDLPDIPAIVLARQWLFGTTITPLVAGFTIAGALSLSL